MVNDVEEYCVVTCMYLRVNRERDEEMKERARVGIGREVKDVRIGANR